MPADQGRPVPMDGATIQRLAVARVQELPGSELTHPFGPEWDVYKVRGKLFLLCFELDGAPVINVKARPEDGASLREAYPEITPGYHMNKRHWITVAGGGRLDPELLEDLVTESYLLVVATLPRRDRPVDPAIFGRA